LTTTVRGDGELVAVTRSFRIKRNNGRQNDFDQKSSKAPSDCSELIGQKSMIIAELPVLAGFSAAHAEKPSRVGLQRCALVRRAGGEYRANPPGIS
jgi:hypothetical protein